MRYVKFLTVALMILVLATPTIGGMNDRSSPIDLTRDGYISLPEMSSAPATPASGKGRVYCTSNNIYFKDDAGTATSMIASALGSVTLDQAYDAGRTIYANAGPVVVDGSGGGVGLSLIQAGAGNTIDLTNTGTGKDIDGTGSTWYVSKAGAATFASVAATSIGAAAITGNINIDDGVTDSPSLTFTDATDETAAFLKTDAGALKLTTDATDGLNILVGNLWVGNGTPGTAAMNGEDGYIEGAFEVDGAAQFDGAVTLASAVAISGVTTLANGATIDNAVDNTIELNENSEEFKLTFNSNDLAFVSTTGVVELSLFDNAADVILSHAADGAADDFYIKQTGANDSSLILSSAGTGADALQITASAGGIDISASGAAATEDIDITATGSSINLTSTEAAAGQITLSAAGTVAGNAITVGSTDGGILVNAAGAANGDVGITAADDVVLTVGDDLTFTVTGDTAINSTATASITSSDWGISTTGAVTNLASVGFDSGSILYQNVVELSNVNIKALRATPIVLAASPGAGKFLELVSATLVLDYGTNVLTESTDNLVIEYGTSNDDITDAIEMTGFIDQSADTVMTVYPIHPQAANAATDMVNNTIELFNTGDGEFGGNAGANTTITVLITYKVHSSGL